MTPEEKVIVEREFRQRMVQEYYITGALATPWWQTGTRSPCWVCSHLTNWVHLDIGHQHPDCDKYPTGYTFGDGVTVDVDVTVIGGKVYSAVVRWDSERREDESVTRVAEGDPEERRSFMESEA